jgi:hypothetical protein
METENPVTVVIEAEAEEPPVPSVNNVEQTLQALATLPAMPKWAHTRNVRDQFSHAFSLVGGVSRLAHWAHTDYRSFMQLYSKLIPAQASLTHDGTIRFEVGWVKERDLSGRVHEPDTIDVTPT